MKNDIIFSFIMNLMNREESDIHNALYIAQKLSGKEELEFRGAGTKGMKSLPLYAIMSEIRGDEKLNVWAKKLKKLNSHQLIVVASYLQNGGSSLTQLEKGEALILLKEELGLNVIIDFEVET